MRDKIFQHFAAFKGNKHVADLLPTRRLTGRQSTYCGKARHEKKNNPALNQAQNLSKNLAQHQAKNSMKSAPMTPCR